MNQLALPLQLADHAVFASFHGAGNETLVATLRSLAAGELEPGCWLWGPAATGKTHLLQAVCDAAGDRAAYVPMALLAGAGPAMLEGLEARDVVCIDDIDEVAADDAWQTALFNLANGLQDRGGRMVVSASAPPRECDFSLADLRSRMSRLAVFQVHPLDEAQRISALQLRAGHRGLELPDETATYLLRRTARDMGSLYDLLDRLDLEALRAQRRLTIPFVRDVLRGS
jgi:DnaA family protein